MNIDGQDAQEMAVSCSSMFQAVFRQITSLQEYVLISQDRPPLDYASFGQIADARLPDKLDYGAAIGSRAEPSQSQARIDSACR